MREVGTVVRTERRSMYDAKVIPVANGHEAETLPSAPAQRERVTPDVVRGGQAGFRIRREGEALDDKPEIERIEMENHDLRRRLSAYEHSGKVKR